MAVRKGSRVPDLSSPFPSGEPRAEAQRRGGVFDLPMGWVGSMLCSLLFWGYFQLYRFSRPRQLLKTAPMQVPFPPSQYTSAPSAISAGYLPTRSRKASRRGRGGVFDQPIGVGRFHALQPTFLGFFSVIPIQLTKAVVENGSDVGPFSPLPIPLCALCDLCGIPPHPDPKAFSDGL